MRDDLADNNAIDRGNGRRLSHLTQGQVLAKQTAIDDDPVRMLAGVPAGYFMRDRLGMMIVAVVVMMMSVIVIMVVMPMIFSGSNRPMEVTRQMRVLTAGPGVDHLSEKLYHQVGGNQSVAAESTHRIPRSRE